MIIAVNYNMIREIVKNLNTRTMDIALEKVVAKYGWTVKDGALYNRKGYKVVTMKQRGSKGRCYFYDQGGNLLMSCPLKSIPDGAEKLLKEYYFCQLV
jgi:hypothetical protein